MRHAAIAGALAALCLATAPTFAHVVEVTTSIGLHEASDPDQLQGAVKSAVETVLAKAIAFVPTAVTVTSARVIGERVYIRLLIVDAEGERALRDLGDGERDEPENNRELVIQKMGGPEMAPQTPQRSAGLGQAVARLDPHTARPPNPGHASYPAGVRSCRTP